MDNFLLLVINGLPHPLWLEKAVLLLDAAGRIKPMVAAVFFLVVLGVLKKNQRFLLGAFLLALTLVASSFLAFVLKDLIHRPRPFLVKNGLHVLGMARGGSFPSGHATLYAALGAFMIFYFNKFKTFWAGVIFLGGLSRVYQGVHYPSDILAGWALGFFISWLILKLHKSFFISFLKMDGL